MKNFRELLVWQKAHRLALDVYETTRSFPREELFGLTSQLRRSVLSVPSNIAEGSGRGGDGEMANFLRIATGSASEVEYQLLFARDAGMLDDARYGPLDDAVCEVKRMLAAFLGAIHKRTKNSRPTRNPDS